MKALTVVAMWGLSAAVFAQAPAELIEEECNLVVKPAQGKAEVREAPGLKVLGVDAPFVAPAVEEGAIVRVVICWRSETRFVTTDRRVVDAGYPLSVKTTYPQSGVTRTLILDKPNGSFRVRLLDGPAFTDAEEVDLRALVSTLNRDKAVAAK